MWRILSKMFDPNLSKYFNMIFIIRRFTNVNTPKTGPKTCSVFSYLSTRLMNITAINNATVHECGKPKHSKHDGGAVCFQIRITGFFLYQMILEAL